MKNIKLNNETNVHVRIKLAAKTNNPQLISCQEEASFKTQVNSFQVVMFDGGRTVCYSP